MCERLWIWQPVCESGGALRWVARSGKVRTMRLPGGWLTVSDALELPLPDTSWMDEPWSRGDVYGVDGAPGADMMPLWRDGAVPGKRAVVHLVHNISSNALRMTFSASWQYG